jgi:hypothetical protein
MSVSVRARRNPFEPARTVLFDELQLPSASAERALTVNESCAGPGIASFIHVCFPFRKNRLLNH